MINIAICDDNPKDLYTISEFLNDYLKLHPDLDFSICKYSSSRRLLDEIHTTSFDIYLLDILMPVSNGIEIGEIIRTKDSSCALLYLTSSPDFAVDSYRVKAQNYLLKPLDREQFFHVLSETIDQLVHENAQQFFIQTSQGLTAVPYHHLISVEYYKHRLFCSLKDDTSLESITLRDSFKKISEPLLEKGMFLKISASVIINMHYVRTVNHKSITMYNGTTFSITRSYHSAKQLYIDYMLKKGRFL